MSAFPPKADVPADDRLRPLSANCCREQTGSIRPCRGFSHGPRADTACHPCEGIPWRIRSCFQLQVDVGIRHFIICRSVADHQHPCRCGSRSDGHRRCLPESRCTCRARRSHDLRPSRARILTALKCDYCSFQASRSRLDHGGGPIMQLILSDRAASSGMAARRSVLVNSRFPERRSRWDGLLSSVQRQTKLSQPVWDQIKSHSKLAIGITTASDARRAARRTCGIRRTLGFRNK